MLCLIDAKNFFHRGAYVHKGLLTSSGKDVGAIFGFYKILRGVLNCYRDEIPIVCWDGGSRRRKSILGDYKKSRKSLDPDKEEDRSLLDQLKLAHELCGLAGVPQLHVPGLEADDLIAYLTIRNHGSIICSTDKDFFQLLEVPDTRLDRGSLSDENLTKSSYIEEKGHTPLQYRLLHCILGDSSDEIPGIKGVGWKTALAVAKHFDDDSLREIPYWDVRRIALELGGRASRIAPAIPDISRNFYLVDLLDTEVLEDEDVGRVEEQLRSPRRFDEEGFLRFIRLLEFNSVLQSFSEQTRPFRLACRETSSINITK